MIYTITTVSRQEKTSKAGKPYTSMGIKVRELGDVWVNGFGNKDNAGWKEGDKIEMTINDDEYNGKISKKFETPKKGEVDNVKLDEILSKITIQNLHMMEIVEWIRKQQPTPKPKITGTDVDYPGGDLGEPTF